MKAFYGAPETFAGKVVAKVFGIPAVVQVSTVTIEVPDMMGIPSITKDYNRYSQYLDQPGALNIDQWLEAEKYEGLTNEDYLNERFAETGADREMCFDLETHQNRAYEAWLLT